MASRVSLERRLGRLRSPETMHFVFVEQDETEAQAVSRYQRDHGKVIEEDHVVHVVSFADPQE